LSEYLFATFKRAREDFVPHRHASYKRPTFFEKNLFPVLLGSLSPESETDLILGPTPEDPAPQTPRR
jgi:hypothetical protein